MVVDTEENSEEKPGDSPPESQEKRAKPPASSQNIEAEGPTLRTPETPGSAQSAPDLTPIPFNENITILPATPLKQFDRGPIKAFRAEGKGKAPQKLIAYICHRSLIPRWHECGNYANIINPNAIYLIASGSVYWPPEKAERFILIYKDNLGQRLFPPREKLAYHYKQDVIMERLIRPMTSLLADFHDKSFVHGNVRLDNFFDCGAEGLKQFVVGDALSTPSGYNQPALFEPVDRAMADPIGRGIGTFADDIYAFGVVITILLRNHDPLEGVSEKDIIKEKLERGSYAALTGRDRFTGAILELLRGILHDDRSQRWTIDEIQHWLDGQRLGPKQTLKRIKASRVFHLEGKRYTQPEHIALDLPDHPDHVLQIVEDDKLMQWLTRSLEDEEAAARLEQAIETARDFGAGENLKHRLITRTSIALDPAAPIRYKNLKLLPEGFAPALAKAFANNQSLNPFAAMIEENVIMFWLNSQTQGNVDYGSISTRFESCRAYIKNKGMGYGLERCLYFLHAEAPCMSEKLKDYYPKNPEDIVYAFEDKISKGGQPKLFIDRHVAAFLSIRDSKMIDSYLIELNSDEEYKNILGNIWVMTMLQRKYNTGPLPYIAGHIVSMMGPVLLRFHDRRLRERLEKEFALIKKSGELAKLSNILENVEIIEKDLKAFHKAMHEFHQLKQEKRDIEERLEDKGKFGTGIGRTIAAVLSAVVGGMIIIILSFLEFSTSANSSGLF